MTDKNNGVLVVVEVAESQPVDLGLEMLGLARQLIDGLGGVVTAVANQCSWSADPKRCSVKLKPRIFNHCNSITRIDV